MLKRESSGLSETRFVPPGIDPALPGSRPQTDIVWIQDQPFVDGEYISTPGEWDHQVNKGKPTKTPDKGPWPTTPARDLGVPISPPRGSRRRS